MICCDEDPYPPKSDDVSPDDSWICFSAITLCVRNAAVIICSLKPKVATRIAIDQSPTSVGALHRGQQRREHRVDGLDQFRYRAVLVLKRTETRGLLVQVDAGLRRHRAGAVSYTHLRAHET